MKNLASSFCTMVILSLCATNLFSQHTLLQTALINAGVDTSIFRHFNAGGHPSTDAFKSDLISSAVPSSFQKAPYGTISPASIVATNRVNRHISQVLEETEEMNEADAEAQLYEKLRRRAQIKTPTNEAETAKEENLLLANPVIGARFNAQYSDCGVPDNSMAISNNGTIVSADNCGIYFFSSTGTLLGLFSYADFLNTDNGIFSDPRVLYDSDKDRFIFLILSDIETTPTLKGKLTVAFSTTNNPMDMWYRYTFDDHQPAFFDFPSAALSSNEIFISGNLFDNSSISQNYLYHINKNAGYLGQSLQYWWWENGFEQPGNPNYPNAFTVVPLQNGGQGTYGNHMYFAATETGPESAIKDYVYVYDLYYNANNVPQISLKDEIYTGEFSDATMALMPNTNTPIGILSGNRITSGFYLNNVLHFVFNLDTGNGDCGVVYIRYSLIDNTAQAAVTYLEGSDYSYGSLAWYGTNNQDQSAILCFLKSDQSTNPEIRYKYFDSAMNLIPSVLVAPGESYVDVYTGNFERWGDYTTMQRKYNTNNPPSVWLSGSYGAIRNGARPWRTYIAEITECTAPSAPLITASGSTALCNGNSVTLSVQNPCNGCNFSWSNGQSGSSIIVTQAGNYTVQAINNCGQSGTSNSISVTNGQAPSAPLITASGSTALCNGNSVTLSVQNPCNGCNFSWSNGQSGASITVNQAGNYTVQAVNNCGQSGTSNIISVTQEEFVPVFQVNNSCYFAAPAGSNYQWYFGGLPIQGANTQFLVATQTGYYTLSMTAPSNCSGASIPYFADCSAVGIDEPSPYGEVIVYPNPASSMVSVDIDLSASINLMIDVCAPDGRIIAKNLKQTRNGNKVSTQFQVDNLPNGTYYCLIYDTAGAGFYAVKFEVMQ